MLLEIQEGCQTVLVHHCTLATEKCLHRVRRCLALYLDTPPCVSVEEDGAQIHTRALGGFLETAVTELRFMYLLHPHLRAYLEQVCMAARRPNANMSQASR